jgi:hypothetical protein
MKTQIKKHMCTHVKTLAKGCYDFFGHRGCPTGFAVPLKLKSFEFNPLSIRFEKAVPFLNMFGY